MKTPREILFQKHGACPRKLDALRREVLAREVSTLGRTPAWSSTGFLARMGQELFWPCRRIWTGLATVWVLLLIANVAQRDDSARSQAQSPPRVEMVMAFYEQEKILNELLADRAQPVEAVRPRNFEPRPRSEISGITTL